MTYRVLITTIIQCSCVYCNLQLKDCELKADTPSSVDQSPRSAALGKGRGKGQRRPRKPKSASGQIPTPGGMVQPGMGQMQMGQNPNMGQPQQPNMGMGMQGVQVLLFFICLQILKFIWYFCHRYQIYAYLLCLSKRVKQYLKCQIPVASLGLASHCLVAHGATPQKYGFTPCTIWWHPHSPHEKKM